MTTALTYLAPRAVRTGRTERTVTSIPAVGSRTGGHAGELLGDLFAPEVLAGDLRSNTYGQGRAIVPARSRVRRSERLVGGFSTSFDNASPGFLDRWAINVEKFVTSPGGISLSVGAMVLSMGLSPLFL